MDQEREKIQADLRGLLAGEVLCDDSFVQMYSSDASIYEIRPLGVVRPRSTAEVVACLQYATENNLPIHARGAGTGLAGESLGPGIVLDFSRFLRRVLHIGDDTVRVQPGVVLAQLNRELALHGRKFGPDPAMSSVTTMGSVLALDGSGSHWLKYGSAREHVQQMQIVLADGTVTEVGREQVAPIDTFAPTDVSAARRRELVGRVADVLTRRASLIEPRTVKSLVNRCGYHVYDVMREGQLDLPRLLVGSEGTLALTTEATLRTVPLPKHRGLAVLLFEKLDHAARAALEIPKMGASVCDLMDRRLLSIAREADVRYDAMIPSSIEALLLVEYDGDQAGDVRDKLRKTVDKIRHEMQLAVDARMATDADEMELYWRLVQRVVPMLYRLRGSTRPLPFIEDAAIPPESLPDFLVKMQNIFKKHQITASLYSHAGHGQLHVRPFLDLGDAGDIDRMHRVATEFYGLVLETGGTISGEHGAGLSRTWYLREQYGPLYDVFREIKRAFDPAGILNPGKVVGDDPLQPVSNLRPAMKQPVPENNVVSSGDVSNGSGSKKPTPISLQLQWSQAEITQTAKSCNGCGQCRTQLPDTRMCPIFRFAPSEEASPRAKANLVRAAMLDRISPTELQTDTLKAIFDLCVNCHQCRLECPAEVDIPKLMVEAKAQYVATNGLRFRDWVLARLDTVASWGSMIRPIANWALGNRQMRWLLEKTLGIAHGRKLPKLAARSFMRRAHRRRLTRPTRRSGPKVLYFVDVYANWFDVELADALVSVLEHNGVAVYVPPRQMQAGMSLITMGGVEKARRMVARNVSLLSDAVRQGYSIVTTEPSAALCLTHEYRHILDDPDSKLVAENTSEACDFLWRLHQQGKLELDLKPVNASLGYHLPCHQRALGVGTPGENLLRLIPGLSVQRIEKGCSGMAGTFGLSQANYRSSIRAGWGLISAVRDPIIQVGVTECSTCKLQMEQGTTKPTVHPLKLLALAYGIMPELNTLLSRRSQELIVS